MPAGRPKIEFNQDYADLLCEAIASSSKSLNTLVKEFTKQFEDFPRISTIYAWLRENQEFSKQYALSKDDQADFLTEEMLDIADDDSLDVGFTEDGKPFVKGENIQRARLRVDTRKWIASKLKPKKYGEKVAQEITGADGGPIEIHKREMTEEELLAIASRGRARNP